MEEKILDLLAEICEDDRVKKNMDVELFDSGLLDSLGLAELLAELEVQAGVVISPSEIEREDMNTPGKILELCRQRM